MNRINCDFLCTVKWHYICILLAIWMSLIPNLVLSTLETLHDRKSADKSRILSLDMNRTDVLLEHSDTGELQRKWKSEVLNKDTTKKFKPEESRRPLEFPYVLSPLHRRPTLREVLKQILGNTSIDHSSTETRSKIPTSSVLFPNPVLAFSDETDEKDQPFISQNLEGKFGSLGSQYVLNSSALLTLPFSEDLKAKPNPSPFTNYQKPQNREGTSSFMLNRGISVFPSFEEFIGKNEPLLTKINDESRIYLPDATGKINNSSLKWGSNEDKWSIAVPLTDDYRDYSTELANATLFHDRTESFPWPPKFLPRKMLTEGAPATSKSFKDNNTQLRKKLSPKVSNFGEGAKNKSISVIPKLHNTTIQSNLTSDINATGKASRSGQYVMAEVIGVAEVEDDQDDSSQETNLELFDAGNNTDLGKGSLLELIKGEANLTETTESLFPNNDTFSWMNSGEKVFADVIIHRALPVLFGERIQGMLSSDCHLSLLQTTLALKEHQLWAIQLLESWGKFPNGYLEGNSLYFGSYDNCLDVIVPESQLTSEERIRGQYCISEVTLKLPNTAISFRQDLHFLNSTNDSSPLESTFVQRLRDYPQIFHELPAKVGICIPSTCSQNDTGQFIQTAAKRFHLDVKIKNCETKHDRAQFTLAQCLIITGYCILGALIIWGTIVELKEKAIIAENVNGKPAKQPVYLPRVLKSFSVIKNVRELLDTTTSSNTLKPIHGIRVISMMWIIMTHTYVFAYVHVFNTLVQQHHSRKGIFLQGILNGILVADSFFMISGLLSTYTILSTMEKSKGKISIGLHLLRRYFRLTPAIAGILSMVFIWSLVGSGPLWNEYVAREVQNCRRNWWTNVLYINNWIPLKDMCQLHLWYLGVDFQITIICLGLILTLYRNPKKAFGVMIFLSLALSICLGVVAFILEWPPTLVLSRNKETQLFEDAERLLTHPFGHITPYFVGITTGYVIHKRRIMKVSLRLQALLWMVSLVLSLTVLWATYPWNNGTDPEPISGALYTALHRPVWAAAIGWIIYACFCNIAGPLNQFLSWKVFVPFSKLSYTSYLVHLMVIWGRYAVRRENLTFSHYSLLCEFILNLVISLCTAFILHLSFEAPCTSLIRIIFAWLGKFGEPKESMPLENKDMNDAQSIVTVEMTEGSFTEDASSISTMSTLSRKRTNI